ncbi:FixH family protein [Rhizobium sp. WSM1274]|uniref:FixH family protein n=1 Tax=unclassified Rhizobium TaxID=2613769 RepID=UPI0021A84F04|nr:FixH family protein [Rhizobium leguminosarum]UWM80229.1 FixH family protein [Rhizobium leguminosarum bv. viciae]UWU26992.1 FixH family protein [Rhizobium leguminosarum bv. viciae]
MTTASQGFTGRHMLIATCSFFAVVIGVNVIMAWFASSSWSGLVVENTYVASQEFNRKVADMKAMAASGIIGSLSLDGGRIHYDIRNRDGSPVIVDDVTANFKRPVGDHEDFHISFTKVADGQFESRHRVGSGDWIVEVISRREGKVVMHEASRLDTAGFGE